jgi:hypothetical protein
MWTRRALLARAGVLAGGALVSPHWQAPPTLTVAQFIQMSAVLTGVPASQLDQTLARTYLDSLQALTHLVVSPAALFQQAGFGSANPPTSLDALTSSPLFQQADVRVTVDTIIQYWFTGVYDTPSGQQVATYTEALAWQVIRYGRAPTECHGLTGAWANAPS